MSQTTTDTHTATAQRIQEKYDFFFVAVTFTILGLAIETADFGIGQLNDAAEIGSWGFLLIGALAGMSRVELAARTHHLYALIDAHRTFLSPLQEALGRGADVRLRTAEAGETADPNAVVAKGLDAVKAMQAKASTANRGAMIRYYIAHVSFLVGVVLLGTARAANGLSVSL